MRCAELSVPDEAVPSETPRRAWNVNVVSSSVTELRYSNFICLTSNQIRWITERIQEEATDAKIQEVPLHLPGNIGENFEESSSVFTRVEPGTLLYKTGALSLWQPVQ